jgi:hypothetical protein
MGASSGANMSKWEETTLQATADGAKEAGPVDVHT